VVALIYLCASWFGNMLTPTPAVQDIIWTANGILLAFILQTRRRFWASYMLMSVVANVAVHIGFGFTFYQSLLFTMGNTVEVLVAATWLSTDEGIPPDLTKFRILARFVCCAVILAPLSSTLFVWLCLNVFERPYLLKTVLDWLVGDIMGIALMTPLFLAIDRTELKVLFGSKKRLEAAAIFVSVAAVSSVVFLQDSLPIIFLVVPVLLLAVFYLRGTGAAIAILLIAAPAVYFTERYSGPFSISGPLHNRHGIFLLQIFLCVNLAVVYAVNSALNARDRLFQDMSDAFQEANAKAAIDHPTGLANRLSLDMQLAREWYNAVREQSPFSLLFIDVDNFKLYNDSYGQLAGDKCLRQVARILGESLLRSSDMVARYDGEEFVVVLPRATKYGALVLAERIRQCVENARLPHKGTVAGIVTISVGVATIVPAPHMKPDDIIHLADLALYQAKNSGRNRVASWDAPTVEPAIGGATA
jgi:diguanylate cyclase (GGDEF)-like protein